MYFLQSEEFQNFNITEVEVIRIADYINNVVGERRITNSKRGAVVMKLDVEVSTSLYPNKLKSLKVAKIKR